MNMLKQRKSERINFWAPIEYSCENSNSFFGAEVFNYSDGGACLETGYEMRPGSKIIIQIDEKEENRSCPKIKHGRKAKVIWCKNSPGQKAFFYWVGVEFIENE